MVRHMVQSVDNPDNLLRAEQVGSGERLPGVTRQPTLEFAAMQEQSSIRYCRTAGLEDPTRVTFSRF